VAREKQPGEERCLPSLRGFLNVAALSCQHKLGEMADTHRKPGQGTLQATSRFAYFKSEMRRETGPWPFSRRTLGNAPQGTAQGNRKQPHRVESEHQIQAGKSQQWRIRLQGL
jgi:hypothetical protein